MEQRTITSEQIQKLKFDFQQMNQMMREMEVEFPYRRFTLDGHLVGSIGEILAAYHYGIRLFDSSTKIHDGEVDDKKVQIKITQRKTVMVSEVPEYLLMLFLDPDGNIAEVFNGPGKIALENSSKKDSHGYWHLSVKRLCELDMKVKDEERISAIIPVEKFSL